MIPVRIKLRNFMPYRDNVPVLDFTGIHTVSICGDNGNGKSAIIDAMTWALWGETRAKRDGELIHQDQNEMEVEFEFSVSGQDYRIIRKHSRAKKRGVSGNTALGLQISSGDGFRSIDGDTITQTQQKIIDILHMDYGTFTNSAYLRQGHADEFTTSSPAKRKQVLVNILGLNYYDDFEERAKNSAKQRELMKSQLSLSIEDINRELQQKADTEDELLKANGELESIESIVKEKESGLKELRQKKELLEAQKARLQQLEQNIAERMRSLNQWQEQMTRLQSRIGEHEALLTEKDDIEAGYRKFVEIRDLTDTLNKNLTVVNKLNQRHHELELFIERETQKISKEHALLQNKVNELEKSVKGLPALKNDALRGGKALQDLSQQEETLQGKTNTVKELAAGIKSLESEKNRLEKEFKGINEKLDLLLSQSDTVKCPVCRSELGADGLQHLSQHYDVEKKEILASIKNISAEISEKSRELRVLEQEINTSQKNLGTEKQRVQIKLGTINGEIARAEESERQLKAALSDLNEIEEIMVRKEFALSEQESIKTILNELDAIGYDSQKHEQMQRDLNDLRKYENSKQKLDEALNLLDQERNDLKQSESSLKELREGLASETVKQQEISKEVTALPEVTGKLNQAEAETNKLRSEQKRIQEQIGVLKGRQAYFERRETERKGKEDQLNGILKEAVIYRELAEAFGKKGIQALLIETALPEIEIEANHLLARMTDNRMHVKIETQKETQKGEVAETLDIKISDELGTRNYEMYSGGEAFRINFAIRIALSRLLTRRAGAPLPTLIIDEGFGTQDAFGIEKLKEAINSVKDDFEKILVITHVEELRDAFSARIDVVKTADGSTISLN